MANCTTESLVNDSRCLVQGMNERQLLASILCTLATANGMECDAATLIENSRCLEMAMSDRQLLASIAFVLCEGGGGGGGHDVIYWEDTGPLPSGPPTDTAIAWTVHFRDGFPPVTWDPDIQDWA